mmetsp:Transcript_79609/g.165357  ORF Transcript_79609/g.165357 Transcript_79609/m.165357 type:complete len:210 (+) Transcript_79609:312-941(+)
MSSPPESPMVMVTARPISEVSATSSERGRKASCAFAKAPLSSIPRSTAMLQTSSTSLLTASKSAVALIARALSASTRPRISMTALFTRPRLTEIKEAATSRLWAACSAASEAASLSWSSSCSFAAKLSLAASCSEPLRRNILALICPISVSVDEPIAADRAALAASTFASASLRAATSSSKSSATPCFVASILPRLPSPARSCKRSETR